MKNIVQLVREHRFIEAEDQIDDAIPLIMEKKLFEMKKAVAAKMCEQMGIKTASEKIRGELTEDEKEEHLDEMQIGKSSGISNMAKDMRLSQEPEWTKTNDNLKGYRNPEPRLPDANPHAFKSNTPTHSIVPNKKLISKYIKPNLEEETEEELDEARINIVRARVRGGKVQRRKKVSNVAGMTMRGGTLKRMSAAERRRRKMGARRGKVKRRAKLSRSLMKRKRSLQKRKSLGL